MGNDRLNTTEANADLAALLERATPGPWFVAGVRVKLDRQDTHAICQYDETLKRDMNIANVWYDPRTNAGQADAALIARAPDLAADKLRLTALVAALTAANAALAADNARLMKRVEEARGLIARLVRKELSITNDIKSAHSGRGSGAAGWMREDDADFRADLAAMFEAARAWLAGGAE